MDMLAAYFALSDVPGHASYVIIALSYCLTNIYWLRVAAVLGLGLEILYFALTSSQLYTGIAWDVIFISINTFHLVLLTRDRFSVSLGKAERELLKCALSGLCNAQIAKVLKTGTWRELSTGSCLMVEGGPVGELHFVQRGRLAVYVNGVHVAELGPGALVGEIAFLMNNAATATVIADTEVRLIAFDRDRLMLCCRSDEQISAAVHRLIGHDLAAKSMRSDPRWMPQPVSERAE
jgi:hypothetical protein